MVQHPVASYLPEQLIIKLGPELQVIDKNGCPVPFPTPAALGFFFHEYIHYLHNISTICGLSGFLNTVGLWRIFRQTIDLTGYSIGSEHLEEDAQSYIERLLLVLSTGRTVAKAPIASPHYPKSVKIITASLQSKIEDSNGTLISTFTCEAEIIDDRGNSSSCQIEIGIPEIMEAAAWLLENRLVSTIAPNEPTIEAPVFPYQLVSALAEYLLPQNTHESTLICVLASLQSSDPADALHQIFQVAKLASEQQRELGPALFTATVDALTANETSLLQTLFELETEFSGEGIMAVAMRKVICAARDGLEMRRINPFFEIEVVDKVAAGYFRIDDLMRQIPSCAAIQHNFGNPNQIQRDFLVSFLPENPDNTDPEAGLRVIHAVFDFMGRHCSTEAIFSTSSLSERPCPFYTSCGLNLRKFDSSICLRTPWRAADWPHWDKKGPCWYGAAVKVTRPAQS
jgi:hypothetical protein